MDKKSIHKKLIPLALSTALLISVAPLPIEATEVPPITESQTVNIETINYQPLASNQEVTSESEADIITDGQAEVKEEKSKKHFFILGGGLLAIMMITYLIIGRVNKK
ncbi:hypothetical protein ACLGL1_07005 [Peptococcus simiae]|uniref:hypothetical protein n=1 Tax=Peptococcus simiae TaxID=1643805 RepID=UPI00397F11DB